MARSKKIWVVGQFPSRQIKRVRRAIRNSDLDLQIYCPTRKVHQSRKGIVYKRTVPLFANYIFVRYNPEQLTRSEIKAVVPIRVLSRNGKLCRIANDEIKRIRISERKVKRDEDLLRNSRQYLKRYVGRQVLIRDGVFDGTLATIVDVVGVGKLKVEVFIFQRSLICEMGVDYVDFN